jgi:hypothetical protein
MKFVNVLRMVKLGFVTGYWVTAIGFTKSRSEDKSCSYCFSTKSFVKTMPMAFEDEESRGFLSHSFKELEVAL